MQRYSSPLPGKHKRVTVAAPPGTHAGSENSVVAPWGHTPAVLFLWGARSWPPSSSPLTPPSVITTEDLVVSFLMINSAAGRNEGRRDFLLLSSWVRFCFFIDDHSRVILSHVDGVPCSDYINASYIDVGLPFPGAPPSPACTPGPPGVLREL